MLSHGRWRQAARVRAVVVPGLLVVPRGRGLVLHFGRVRLREASKLALEAKRTRLLQIEWSDGSGGPTPGLLADGQTRAPCQHVDFARIVAA